MLHSEGHTHLDVIRKSRFDEGRRGHQTQSKRWSDKLHSSKLRLLSDATWETERRDEDVGLSAVTMCWCQVSFLDWVQDKWSSCVCTSVLLQQHSDVQVLPHQAVEVFWLIMSGQDPLHVNSHFHFALRGQLDTQEMLTPDERLNWASAHMLLTFYLWALKTFSSLERITCLLLNLHVACSLKLCYDVSLASVYLHSCSWFICLILFFFYLFTTFGLAKHAHLCHVIEKTCAHHIIWHFLTKIINRNIHSRDCLLLYSIDII